ncbi:uncharacterized protein LOC116138700 [Pistacia vera]|uniref:uncharacterized protein LOC116138700 n=1 Tax=Pistacia vera TaxID=55513 RepID=UPI0012638FC1|nr:uncharacterized protein LOC116138700 [Pistacia vera]
MSLTLASLTTWDAVYNKFIGKFYSHAKTAEFRGKIATFSQMEDSSFAIKCGGEEMKVDIIVREADSYGLGGVSCIILDTEKLAISDADFTPTVGIGRKKKSGLIVGIAVALGSLGLILIFLILHMRIKRDDDAEVLLGIGPKLKIFSYVELEFGVVALEIMSGRANSDTSLDREKIYLLEWAWSLHESNQSLGLIDTNLAEFSEIKALRISGVPLMSCVVNMLAGEIEVETVSSKPSCLTDWASLFGMSFGISGYGKYEQYVQFREFAAIHGCKVWI